MVGAKQRLSYIAGSVGALAAALGLVVLFSPNLSGQAAKPPVKIAGGFENIKILPPGGATPRTADGHPDLTGRYYPNQAGRMLQGAYRVDNTIMRQYDPAKTPQENPVFRPETKAKYQFPTPYGICAPGGTPTSITTQATEHGPMEIVQLPGRVWILSEFPETIRYIPTDGRKHSDDPDVSFNGESVGRWEGDTLVVDTVAIDERMRNISVGQPGDASAWTHSDKEHVIERFTRTSKNYLMYQVTVEDPVVLTKPFTSAPLAWTLAQDPKDIWTEYKCTANEEPDNWKNVDSKYRDDYEKGRLDGQGEAAPAETGAGRGGRGGGRGRGGVQ
jgi:hypothetical protein